MPVVTFTTDFGMHDGYPTFHGRDIFAPTAGRLAAGARAADAGPAVSRMIDICAPPVHRRDGVVEGEVIHIDGFGNLITSLPADALICTGNAKLVIEVDGTEGRFEPQLGRTFSAVDPGALIAYTGSGGQLEIGRRDGSAALRVGAKRGTPVRVRSKAIVTVSRHTGLLPAGAAIVALVSAAVAMAGCTVGSGSGSATGALWVNGCTNNGDYGSPMAPAPFDLQPTFFAGEPIEDLSIGLTHQNLLLLRIQRTGLAIQYNDTLHFDIENSYEVARCVRGKTNGGQPLWNQTEVLYNQTSVDWCDWSANAFSDGGAADGGINPGSPDAGASLDGGMSVMALYPRIHITPDTDLRSSLALLTTCPQADVSAEANDGPLDVSGRPADVSWIEFMDFGAAEQSDLTPEMRSDVPGDFVIDFGGRLRANFHLILQDSRVITAVETNQPKPAPMLGGTLDGYFDFELARGRAAQAFP
jgi:hypothetical protein